MNTGRCSDCKQTIRWTITERGKRMALDPDSVEGGNVIILHSDARGNEYNHVLHKGEVPTTPTYVAHIVTCPARKGN